MLCFREPNTTPSHTPPRSTKFGGVWASVVIILVESAAITQYCGPRFLIKTVMVSFTSVGVSNNQGLYYRPQVARLLLSGHPQTGPFGRAISCQVRPQPRAVLHADRSGSSSQRPPDPGRPSPPKAPCIWVRTPVAYLGFTFGFFWAFLVCPF